MPGRVSGDLENQAVVYVLNEQAYYLDPSLLVNNRLDSRPNNYKPFEAALLEENSMVLSNYADGD